MVFGVLWEYDYVLFLPEIYVVQVLESEKELGTVLPLLRQGCFGRGTCHYYERLSTFYGVVSNYSPN